MRLINQLKKELVYLKAAWVYILMGFFIAPIALGLMYGNIFEKMTSTDIKLEPLQIYMAADKDTEAYEAIILLLQQEHIEIIEVEEDEIQANAKQGKNALGLQIQEKRVEILNYGADSTEKTIVRNMIEMSNGQLVETPTETITKSEPIVTRILEQEKRLNSYQVFVAAVYTAMSFFIAVTLATNFIKERQQSMMGRIFSMNISKQWFYSLSLISVLIISFVMVFLYSIIAFKFVLGFRLNWMKLLITNILHAGFITGLYGLFISLFYDEKVFKTYITPIIMVIMILGGSFFPVDMFGEPFKAALFMPNYHLLQLYKGIFLNQPLLELNSSIFILFGMIILCFTIGYIRFPKMETR